MVTVVLTRLTGRIDAYLHVRPVKRGKTVLNRIHFRKTKREKKKIEKVCYRHYVVFGIFDLVNMYFVCTIIITLFFRIHRENCSTLIPRYLRLIGGGF